MKAQNSHAIFMAATILALFATPTVSAFDPTPYPDSNPPDGSAAHPWKIDLPEDFDAIGSDGTHLSNQHYRVVRDIDCENQDHRVRVDFNGTLDGAYHTISRIRIDQPTAGYGGFVNNMVSPGVIRRLAIVGSYFRFREGAGAIVGAMQWGTLVEECFSQGNTIISVTGNGQGGIVGGCSSVTPAATVRNCFARNNTVSSGFQTVGGICGYNDGRIERCYSAGSTLTAPNYVGGVVGYGGGGGVRIVVDSYSHLTNSPAVQVGSPQGTWQNALVPNRNTNNFDITPYSITQLNWDPVIWTKDRNGFPWLAGFNQPPVARAGATETQYLGGIYLGGATLLNGTGSTDDKTPLLELAFAWTVESAPAGSTAVIADAGAMAPLFVPDLEGTYTFKLNVTDAEGLVDEATTSIRATPKLVNGSFENDFTGWTTGGNLGIATLPWSQPTEGTKLAAFNNENRPPNGMISQQIPTMPDMYMEYRLQFDVGVIAYNNLEQRLGVNVLGGLLNPSGPGVMIDDVITLRGDSSGKNRWFPASYILPPGAYPITLNFYDRSTATNSIDVLLDHVRVIPREAILLITSTPVWPYVTVTGDRFEQGSSSGPMQRYYNEGNVVDVAVPAEEGGQAFLYWMMDGERYSSDRAIRFTMERHHHLMAVYAGGPPFILAQPTAAEAVLGGTAEFRVSAGGSTPLTYQWRFNGTDIPGATATELVIDPVEAGDAGTYDVVVTNSLNSVTSDPAELTIQSAFAGLENGSFERDFEGWTVSGNVWVQTPTAFPATDGIKIAAFNAGNTPPNASLFQVITTTPGQTYFLSFDMGVFSYNTFPQTLEVEVTGSPALLSRTFTMNGSGGGRCVWQTHDLSFTADSTRTTLTFRDRSKDTVALDLLLDNIDIVPRLSRSLTVASTGPLPSYGIPVTVSPADDNGDTNGSTPFVRSYVDGTSVDLTVPQTYYTFYAPWVMMTYVFQKWQKDGVDCGTSPVISMTMDGDHTMTAAYVVAPPVITVQPQSITAGPGSTAVFTVGILEDTAAVRYQWRFNGTDISGATLSSLTIGPVDASDAGRYDVVVTNPGGSATSREAVLTVVTGFMANGSFESNFDGWTGGGNVRIQTSPTPTDGVRLVAFNAGNSFQNGWISQTFTTTPGITYLLSFDMGVLAYNTNEQRLQVDLTGNAALATQVFSMRGPGGGRTLWETKSLTFTADSTATNVIFRDRSETTAAIDLLLDNVRLVEELWLVTTVDDSGVVGEGNSLAFGPDGQPAISYYDGTNSDLKFARYNGSTWSNTTVDATGDVGYSTSMAFGPDGQPAVSYYDSTNVKLKFARFNDSAWAVSTVTIIGQDPSLAFGPDGQPAISHVLFDIIFGEPWWIQGFSRSDGSSWIFTGLDGNNTGGGNCLAFDPDGQPAVSYYDSTNTNLKFARFTGSAWSVTTVDATEDVGMDTSLAFGPDGQPAISYYDITNGNLRFARFNGTMWTVTTVDATGEVGRSTSLAFGPDGQPAISYFDFTNRDLKFARFNGSMWTVTTVDATGDVGHYTSLAFGPDGQPAISYYDSTNGNLKFARRGIFPPAP